MLKPSLFFFAACLCAGTAAASGDKGLYLGGSIGEANTRFEDATVSVADSQGAFKGMVGFRLPALFALEADYLDFGKASENGSHVSARAFAGYLMYYLPIPLVDLYAKAGYANWKGEGELSTRLDKNQSDLAYGAGAQLGWGKVAVRVEYDKINASNPGRDLSMVSAGLTYTFF